MSSPVEPVRAPSILPLWVMAIAITTVAIRYTFFPPCCTTSFATRVVAMEVVCDSVRPVPGGDCIGDGDTLIYAARANALLQQHGVRHDTIPVPPGGSVELRAK